jgi:hypothetical protein
MRTLWMGLTCLLAVVGCSATDQDINRPPPVPPQYVLPPQDEARYSAPPEFPEKTLNDRKKRSDPLTPGGLRGPRQGMGGMGMGAQ